MRVFLSYLLLITFIFIPITVTAKKKGYVGSRACKVCHIKEYNAWKNTGHAYAFDSLKPLEKHDEKREAGIDHLKDYTVIPKCLQCHVTGFGKAGGFINRRESPDMIGVGCEMCHGPGDEYMKIMIDNPQFDKQDAIDAGLQMADKKKCLNCHNKKNPFFNIRPFNFEEAVQNGIH
ncbi:MAG: cytochrome c family protein [Nitrospirota bacterium]